MKQPVIHYALLDDRGWCCGSVWATSVKPKDDPADGFWFLFRSEIIAATNGGYKVMPKGEVIMPAKKASAPLGGAQ